jgi:hypothetical protein
VGQVPNTGKYGKLTGPKWALCLAAQVFTSWGAPRRCDFCQFSANLAWARRWRRPRSGDPSHRSSEGKIQDDTRASNVDTANLNGPIGPFSKSRIEDPRPHQGGSSIDQTLENTATRDRPIGRSRVRRWSRARDVRLTRCAISSVKRESGLGLAAVAHRRKAATLSAKLQWTPPGRVAYRAGTGKQGHSRVANLPLLRSRGARQGRRASAAVRVFLALASLCQQQIGNWNRGKAYFPAIPRSREARQQRFSAENPPKSTFLMRSDGL